jgi:hypothetical protein
LKEKKFFPVFSKFDFRKSYRLVKKGHAKMIDRTRSLMPLWKTADRSKSQKTATNVGSVNGGNHVVKRSATELYDEKDMAALDPDDGG